MAWNNNRGGGQNRGPANYLRSSSLKINTIFNGQLDQNGKDVKEPFPLDFDTTHEVSFTLTAEKAQDLINRVAAAMDDPQGTGGIRVSMYCRKSQNQSTNEEFDGAGILIYAQKPAQNGFGGGRGRGSFQGRGGGGGRRSYPSQQAQGRGQPQQRGGNAYPNDPVQQDTPQDQAPPQGAPTGRGPTAPRSASPSRAPARAPARQAQPASPPPAEPQTQGGPPTPEDCPI